ncbi:hypothetical protein FRC12_019515 [Ceratobasidium sp. 428]|nr:hypothetical protein FRC12_019515 [Ceratobasidium sp. 428]
MLNALARQDNITAGKSSGLDQTSTGMKLGKLMAYHQRGMKAHAYDKLAASIVRAIWLFVEVIFDLWLKSPIKTLQFVSATSILAPFFHIFLEAPVTFAVKDIKINEAVQVCLRSIVLAASPKAYELLNLHKPDLNRSTSNLLQIEEILWPGVFDLIQQCRDGVATPTFHWDVGHSLSKDWMPVDGMRRWRWAKHQMITDGSAGSQGLAQVTLTTSISPSHDLPVSGELDPPPHSLVPQTDSSDPIVSLQSGAESGRAGDNMTETLMSDVNNTASQNLQMDERLGATDVGMASGLNPVQPNNTNKEQPALLHDKEETVKSRSVLCLGNMMRARLVRSFSCVKVMLILMLPPAKKQKKHKRPSKKNKNQKQDLKAKLESSPPFKLVEPANLTRNEVANLGKIDWTFNEDIKPMDTLYESAKVCCVSLSKFAYLTLTKEYRLFSTKLCVHGSHGVPSPEYVNFSHSIPKVPEQDHNFDFWQTVPDLAVAEQDSLPQTCCPAVHLTQEDFQQLSDEELCSLFKDRSLVIEPSSTTMPTQLSHFEDDKGKITLERVMDPYMKVEVHDMAGSSLEVGGHQATYQTSTLRGVFNHIKSDNGHLVNLLNITDASGLFEEPLSVLKLNSDRYAHTSTQRLKDTDEWTPKLSWLIVGGGGAGLSNKTPTGSWTGLHCMVIYAWWRVMACDTPSPYPTNSLAALVLMCQHPQYFTNLTGQLPPDIEAYRTQKKKARVAASELHMHLAELDAAVVLLKKQLDGWVEKLYYCWDKELEAYRTEVFEETDDEDKPEPESEEQSNDEKSTL